MRLTPALLLGLLCLDVAAQSTTEKIDDGLFRPIDVFQLEYASDPRISPDGKQIVYVRNFMDIMKDRRRTNLWIVSTDGRRHRPLTTGNQNDGVPRWSPDGTRLLYASTRDGSYQLYLRWMDTGQTAELTHLIEAPGSLSWSPDGKWIAFSMRVPEPAKPFAKMPRKPKGAQWAAPAKVITKLRYRADGAGYLRDGHAQIFVLSADGGTPRQLTTGPYDQRGTCSWTPDSKALVFSANRGDPDYEPLDSEIYELRIADGKLTRLTKRYGPDRGPRVSPAGDKIAFTGFDDKLQGYQVTRLYVMNRDGTGVTPLTTDLDRSVSSPVWRSDGSGVFVRYDDHGRTRIASVSLHGEVTNLVNDVGGTSLGRPYPSGSFTASRDGRIAYALGTTERPADVGFRDESGTRRLTGLNEDLFGHKKLGTVEELSFQSSFDRRPLQGWVVKPPSFDPNKRYPLILEIHGGPFLNYGFRFSAEIQLYAAKGYVVLYMNPRGSTGYGGEFGNLIHHNYPGQDYDDLMSGVDAVLAKGYVDKSRLFVTGGSGGGVLTAWIVGKTDRFRAAVVAKPVINWYSFALTSDGYNVFYKYWFPGFPWDYPEDYLKRSPISLVGNVTTPTMLLIGEADHRTPVSESEQFYQALKLRKVETAMVRIPGASHGITARPSNLIAKVVHVLEWFDRHNKKEQ